MYMPNVQDHDYFMQANELQSCLTIAIYSL